MTSMDVNSPTTHCMAITPVFPTDNSDAPISEEQPNKRRRKKSIVWEHFTIETVGAGCMRACCKQCKKSFAYITGSKLAGTSHLKRHIALGICPVSRQKNEALQSTPGAKTDPPKRRYRTSPVFGGIPFDQDRCNQEVARMIIQHEYPLHIVEHPSFIDFVKTLQPQYNMASFNTIQGECVALYLKEKQSLLNLISGIHGRVSLSLDLGTSNFNIGYAFLTGHFIDDDWNLRRQVLNVIMLPFPDSDYAFHQAVASCLSDWQLENRLFTLTLDESFSNETMTGNLRSLLSIRNRHLFNGQLLRGKCYARVLSRLAQDALGTMGDVVRRIRESVKYVKTSESHDEKFTELKQRLQVPSTKELIIDDLTKWNTTYQMLVAACELKEVFACLDTTDPVYRINPSMDDWKQVEVLCTYLKLLHDAASILTGPTYPPANAFYHEVSKVQLELTHAAMSQDPFVSNLTRPLKEKFDQYWKECFLVLALAVVMDPRFKMKLIEFSFARIFGEDAGMWIKIVDDGIHELFLEYLAPNLSVQTSYMETHNVNISHSEFFQEMPPQEVAHQEAHFEEVPLQVVHPAHVVPEEANRPGATLEEAQPQEMIPQVQHKEEPPQDPSPQVQQEMHTQLQAVTHEVPVKEEMQTEDGPVKEIYSQEVPHQEMDKQAVPLQETDAQELLPQEMQTEEYSTQEMQTQEYSNQEMQNQEVLTQDIHSKEEPTQETHAEEVPTEEMHAQGVPAEEMHAQEVQTEEMHAQEVRTEEMHAQEVRTEEMHAQEVPTEGMHAQEVMTEEMYSHEVPTGEMHAQEVPTEGMHTHEIPIGEIKPREGQNEETHPQDEQNEGVHLQEGQKKEMHPQGGENGERHPQEKIEEVQPQVQTEEVQPQVQTEEVQPQVQAEEVQPQVQAEEVQPQVQAEEVQPQVQAEEVQPQVQAEEVQPQEQAEEIQPQEMYLSEGQTQDMQPDKAQTQVIQPPDAHDRDMHLTEAQTLEMHLTEAQTQEIHLTEVQTQEMHPTGAETQEMHSLEAQTQEMHFPEEQTQEMQSREAEVLKMQPEEAGSQEMHIQEVQMHEANHQELPSQEVHSQELQFHETHHQEVPNQGMHSQELQTQEMHYRSFSEEMQAHDVHAQDLPLLTIGDGLSDFEVYISEITNSQHLKSELDQYLDESLLPRVQEFDVLAWWKLNKLKYPILSKMAADILSIPVSTVAPDSVFNTGSKKIDSYWSSLRPVTLEALVCAKDWLQFGPSASPSEMSNALVKMEF